MDVSANRIQKERGFLKRRFRRRMMAGLPPDVSER
jgi:hypothetical protein